jgi:hypothetical protein
MTIKSMSDLFLHMPKDISWPFTKRDQPARQIREDAATAGDGRHCPF